MLYMVGNIFLDGISFNIVYNESDHENMKHLEYLFFTQKTLIFLKQRWRVMKQYCVIIETCIYQVGVGLSIFQVIS